LIIITKEFQKFDIRILVIQGKEWFVAKDTANLLGYQDTDGAIRKHCKKTEALEDLISPAEMMTLDLTQITTPNNYKKIKFIPESDVWRLLEKARTKTAYEKLEIKKYIGLSEDIKVILSRPEVEFILELEKALKVFNIKSIKQFQVFNFKIDLYLPELKIAIEFDENDHRHYDFKSEKQRKDFIEETLNCQFLRLSDKDSVGTNIGKVLLFISRI
jgi:very-short-patch-repair endonuclease